MDPTGYICQKVAEQIRDKVNAGTASRSEQKKLESYIRLQQRNGAELDADYQRAYDKTQMIRYAPDQLTVTSQSIILPTEPYNRRKHYGSTPTKTDRKIIGGSPDHDPPLVKRYYEGDPSIGEKPGYLQTPEERRLSAADRSRMKSSTIDEQRKQGAEMAKYSKERKKHYGFK